MEFLTTKGIAASIEKIIRDAKEYIVIISPYVKVDSTYLERLYEAEQRHIKIYLIFGKEDLRDLEKEKIQRFKNIKIYYLENLHAKCYMNESIALITSMNLYGYSEANNREMGIEIDRNHNQELYESISNEALSIRQSAKEYNNHNWNNSYSKPTYENNYSRTTLGYCIRCRKRIELNLYRPLCDSCYPIWSQYGNTDYQEQYCHKCGKQIDSWDEKLTYAHPICSNCDN